MEDGLYDTTLSDHNDFNHFFFNFTVRPLLADIPQRQEMAGLGILI